MSTSGVDIGHVKKEVLDRAAFAAWTTGDN